MVRSPDGKNETGQLRNVTEEKTAAIVWTKWRQPLISARRERV
jgi:hypothetical protein